MGGMGRVARAAHKDGVRIETLSSAAERHCHIVAPCSPQTGIVFGKASRASIQGDGG